MCLVIGFISLLPWPPVGNLWHRTVWEIGPTDLVELQLSLYNKQSRDFRSVHRYMSLHCVNTVLSITTLQIIILVDWWRLTRTGACRLSHISHAHVMADVTGTVLFLCISDLLLLPKEWQCVLSRLIWQLYRTHRSTGSCCWHSLYWFQQNDQRKKKPLSEVRATDLTRPSLFSTIESTLARVVK